MSKVQFQYPARSIVSISGRLHVVRHQQLTPHTESILKTWFSDPQSPAAPRREQHIHFLSVKVNMPSLYLVAAIALFVIGYTIKVSVTALPA